MPKTAIEYRALWLIQGGVKVRSRFTAERGTWFLFLPEYSSDLNPIEQAFARPQGMRSIKLKALIRKSAARTYDSLWRALGDICAVFDPLACWNCLKDAGYLAN